MYEYDVEGPRKGLCIVEHLRKDRPVLVRARRAWFDVLLYQPVSEPFTPAFGLADLVWD
jgi:hypothetical protein